MACNPPQTSSLICKKKRNWIQPSETRQFKQRRLKQRKQSMSCRMSRLYLRRSGQQMSFCSLVLHKQGVCCCISSSASQFLEHLVIKWHKPVNQHTLVQGGGGHLQQKAKQSSGFTERTDLGRGSAELALALWGGIAVAAA